MKEEEKEEVACCYAKSDKYWVSDPSGIAWETFHTLDTIPVFGEPAKTELAKDACCIPLVKIKADTPCCVPASSIKQSSTCC